MGVLVSGTVGDCDGTAVGMRVGLLVGGSVTSVGKVVGGVKVGLCVGRSVGLSEGELVGCKVGNVGIFEGKLVGFRVGARDGAAVGSVVGNRVGKPVGLFEGDAEGCKVGKRVTTLFKVGAIVCFLMGFAVGLEVGRFVGCSVTFLVGLGVGSEVGRFVGSEVCGLVGLDVGFEVGRFVGTAVGSSLGLLVGSNVTFRVGCDVVGFFVGTRVEGLVVGSFEGFNVMVVGFAVGNNKRNGEMLGWSDGCNEIVITGESLGGIVLVGSCMLGERLGNSVGIAYVVVVVEEAVMSCSRFAQCALPSSNNTLGQLRRHRIPSNQHAVLSKSSQAYSDMALGHSTICALLGRHTLL